MSSETAVVLMWLCYGGFVYALYRALEAFFAAIGTKK
jgi:hypothetical protein